MRTAHIISRVKDKATLVADGNFAAILQQYKAAKPGKGETIEFWSSGYLTKFRGEAKDSKMFKKQSTEPEAVAVDMKKAGKSDEDIANFLKAAKAKVAKAAALLLGLCLFGFSATAQQSLISYLSTTTVAGASTNTTMYGGTIGWNIDQVAVFQTTIVGTNASPTNAVTVLLDTSDNGTDWLTDQYTISVTPAGTTAGSSITRITNSVGGKYLRVGTLKNPNLTAVTVSRLTLSTKQ